MPAWTSIRYCSAPAAAAPPGTTRPSAPEASCDVTTGHHERASTASRCSSHMLAQLSTCASDHRREPVELDVDDLRPRVEHLEHRGGDPVEHEPAHQQPERTAPHAAERNRMLGPWPNASR